MLVKVEQDFMDNCVPLNSQGNDLNVSEFDILEFTECYLIFSGKSYFIPDWS